MTKQMTAQQAVARVSEAAKSNRHETRDASSLKLGEAVRQGDVYLARIEMPRVKGVALVTRQIVEGMTLGSRHIVSGDALLHRHANPASLAPKWVDPERALFLPLVIAGKAGATLTHPEHAHVLLPPSSAWLCWSQLDAQTMQRVQD
jgi:hypothetical protein